jgi:hypothetical protein
MTAYWERPGEEPALHDVLADPIVHLVMKRDGLTQEGVGLYLEAQKRRLRTVLHSRQFEGDGIAGEVGRQAC